MPRAAAAGPAFGCEKKLTANDSSFFATFGHSVAIDGDTLVVGAINNHSAYVFVKSGSTWTQQQKLTETGLGTNDFGNSVGISGNTIVVGFPGNTDLGIDSGSAFVFVRSGTTWSLQQKLIGNDTGPADFFGASVAIDGNTIVVGASSTPAGGAAYVFVRSGTIWSQQQKLIASDAAFSDLFGSAVAISGNTVLIGAPLDDNVHGIDAGSAYVFVRSGTTWTQQQKLIASDGAQLDGFGGSVSLDGNTAAIGAPSHKKAGVAIGVTYVVVRSGTVWTLQQELAASDAADGDGFGGSVSVRGNTLVATSPLDDDLGQDSGSAYVFRRTGTTWSQKQKLTASDAQAGAEFGSAALGAGTLVIGASLDDHDGLQNAGAAYIFEAPVLVNLLVTLNSVTTSFDPTPVPFGPAGTFSIEADFTGTSSTPIIAPFFRVAQLSDGNLLLNADGGPGGVGAILTPDVGADGVLSPGESFTTKFDIGLQKKVPFTFLVDLFGLTCQ
jgi:hypothetical protein